MGFLRGPKIPGERPENDRRFPLNDRRFPLTGFYSYLVPTPVIYHFGI